MYGVQLDMIRGTMDMSIIGIDVYGALRDISLAISI